ncbi:MAG: hypothetical protein IJP74_07095 [Prevotella sp.]|nr:hypothetical protein [Prevotella sp.]
MKAICTLAVLSVLQAVPCNSFAQSATDYLKANKASTCAIPFDVEAEGKALPVTWGMDTAWDWDYNVNRGIAHIGKAHLKTGRVSFQPIDLVTDNGDGTYTLSARQKTRLKKRIDLIKKTGTTEVNLNCDHEVLFLEVNSKGVCGSKEDFTGKNNYGGKPEEWYKLIKASVQYCQSQGLKVISVSPFNEPDYTSWNQYYGNESAGMKDFLAIAKLIKGDSFFDGIRVCGGNTLNCDRALPWYNALKDYLDEGNTHQLAGSFDNYASFFTTVVNDGKLASADELHNVGEAIVGAEYGMTTGIWWGFDGKARGQFCKDSNEGVRIGYGEDRGTWTSGAIYRNDESNEIHAFLGSSERQATNATYSLVSKGKDVYFNGFGPTREYVVDMPGGTGYQKGQINAEKLVDITYGEDVPQEFINGTYQIMSYYSKGVLSTSETTPQSTATVKTNARTANATNQQWVVKPLTKTDADGDICGWSFRINNNDQRYLNLKDLNLNAGASTIVYTHDGKRYDEEKWFLRYAGEGCWYIVSCLSNKALKCNLSSQASSVSLGECPTASSPQALKRMYMWRFMPVDALANDAAPVWTDKAVKTVGYNSSIHISWSPIEDEKVTYNVIRATTGKSDWNTIARSVKGSSFIDNTVMPGSYDYKIVPVAYNGTRGEASEVATCHRVEGEALLAQYQFDDNLDDNSVNGIGMAVNGSTIFSNTIKMSGEKALSLTLQSTFMSVSPSLTNRDNMTVMMWVRWSGGNAWQRIFDFGNSTDEYMFLTPSNGSEMRFVMKDNGDEQIISTTTMVTNTWKHIAVTFSKVGEGDGAKEHVELYIDGENVGSKDFSIFPSQIAPSLNFIGRSMFSSDPMLKGYVDDLRFYNYALTQDKIKETMTDTQARSKDHSDIPNAIEDFNTTGKGTPMAIYSLDGTKVTGMKKGMNIIKYSNGSTVKIIKK